MDGYTEAELLRLAKRFRNAKRPYLLVNPLQGKHLAVRPSDAFAMMRALGAKVRGACPGVRLVIGFAETATAVGMAVAAEQGAGCRYIHTTREDEPDGGERVDFLEEHSHAMEQRLYTRNLRGWLAETDAVAFVDDEISTGRTLLNFVSRLEEAFPEVAGKRKLAVSLINRVPDEGRRLLREAGVECVPLLSLPPQDYAAAVERYEVVEAAAPAAGGTYERYRPDVRLPDPRLGVDAAGYAARCEEFARDVLAHCVARERCGRVAVLGTEECMYPAMIAGLLLERHADVRTHATTRSPIGISTEPGYPVRNGVKLRSLYDEERTTYLYNLDSCDLVLVITDSRRISPSALDDLAAAFGGRCWRLIVAEG